MHFPLQGIRFKVDVDDKDDVNSNDNIDTFDLRENYTPDKTQALAVRRSENLKGKRTKGTPAE